MASMKLKCKSRVLLVEDHPLVQQVHSTHLKQLGCVVDLAETGMQGVEMYNSKIFKYGYDLILLDCGLPDISGIEVSKKIRQYERLNNLSRIPIVMVTAYNTTEAKFQRQCEKAGIDELIAKPVMEWEALLDRWLLTSSPP